MRLKKGLLLRNLCTKSPLFKISTKFFLKIRGGSTPPSKIQGGLRPPQPPPLLWRPCTSKCALTVIVIIVLEFRYGDNHWDNYIVLHNSLFTSLLTVIYYVPCENVCMNKYAYPGT